MAHSTFLCPIDEFQIAYTVICGQTFRWRLDKAGWWACLLPVTDPQTGATQQQLVRLWQDDEAVYYETSPKTRDLGLVRDYFRLDVDLPMLARRFVGADYHIQPAMAAFAGLRVIRQDPVECLFSFLCTSASPLYRIRRMVAALCREYGDLYPGEVAGLTHHAFPPVQRLAEASLPYLTRLGLGYRAAYVKETAQAVLAHGGAPWLYSLRRRSYPQAKAALMALPGVGAKIADCVCLFSLDKDEAVPVDTHIRQIVQRTYLADNQAYRTASKNLTKTAYAEIGDDLRARFGPMAGWAQQYLFFYDLYEQGAWESYTALYQPFVEAVQPLKKDPRKFGAS